MEQFVAQDGFLALSPQAGTPESTLFAPVDTTTGEFALRPSGTGEKTLCLATYPCLISVSGAYAGRAFLFRADAPSLSIGRDSSNVLQIAGDPYTSRHHAAIEVLGNDFIIRDTGSRNGTSVNGTPIQGTALLHVGDTIAIGQNVLQLDMVTSVA